MRFNLVCSLLIFLVISSFSPIEKGDVILSIENVKSSKGVLIIATFDSKENFMKKELVSKIVKPKTKGNLSLKIENLPYGTYAISIIHDENENGELDKNLMGIPKECFGFSNVSMGLFGPPSYKETRFEVNSSEVKVTVKMKDLGM